MSTCKIHHYFICFFVFSKKETSQPQLLIRIIWGAFIKKSQHLGPIHQINEIRTVTKVIIKEHSSHQSWVCMHPVTWWNEVKFSRFIYANNSWALRAYSNMALAFGAHAGGGRNKQAILDTEGGFCLLSLSTYKGLPNTQVPCKTASSSQLQLFWWAFHPQTTRKINNPGLTAQGPLWL